jgi:hypothetical protein
MLESWNECAQLLLMVLLVIVVGVIAFMYILNKPKTKTKTGGYEEFLGGAVIVDDGTPGKPVTVTAKEIFNDTVKNCDTVFKKYIEINKLKPGPRAFDGLKWWQKGLKPYYSKFDSQTQGSWKLNKALEAPKKEVMPQKDAENDANGKTIEPIHFAYQMLTQIGGDACIPRKIAQLAMNVSWLRIYRDDVDKGDDSMGPFKDLVLAAENAGVDFANIDTYMDGSTKYTLDDKRPLEYGLGFYYLMNK